MEKEIYEIGECMHIEVKCDTNDADYIYKISPIDSETLDKLRPLFEAIKNFKPYNNPYNNEGSTCNHYNNWPTGECAQTDFGEKSIKEIYSNIDPDLIDIFDKEFCPYRDNGFHTIESIYVYERINEEKLI